MYRKKTLWERHSRIIFSGWLRAFLIDEYDGYFGFTDEEVRKICGDYCLEHKYELVQKWYNGYIFGETNVYNPWSLVQFIRDLTVCEDSPPKAYVGIYKIMDNL